MNFYYVVAPGGAASFIGLNVIVFGQGEIICRKEAFVLKGLTTESPTFYFKSDFIPIATRYVLSHTLSTSLLLSLSVYDTGCIAEINYSAHHLTERSSPVDGSVFQSRVNFEETHLFHLNPFTLVYN